MSELPLVSISCNTYNHEHYIGDAIEGFLLQRTDFPFEILIHDDASTDGTADVIRRYQALYPELIKPLFQTENRRSQGVRVGRFNLERARGEYIAICEGDDYWTDPLKLQKQVDFLRGSPGNVMCFTNYDKVDANGVMLAKGAMKKGQKVDLTQWDILTRFTPKYLTVMFRRSALDLAFFGKRFSSSGDVVLLAMLTRHGPAKYLDFVSGCYRVHAGGIWSGRSRIEQSMLKLRTSVVIRRIFDRPEEIRAIDTRTGRTLFGIFELAREERSLHTYWIFLGALLRHLSAFGYFLDAWRQRRKRNAGRKTRKPGIWLVRVKRKIRMLLEAIPGDKPGKF